MKDIWANALLCDGKILFWYTGSSQEYINGFYKDFYYAGLNQTEILKEHDCEVRSMRFSFDDEKDSRYNNYCFDVLAEDFYKLFDISPLAKGKSPY